MSAAGPFRQDGTQWRRHLCPRNDARRTDAQIVDEILSMTADQKALRAELKSSGIDVRVFSPPHTSTAAGNDWPLDLPNIFEPAWVAQQFVRALRRDAPRTLPGGNGMLLLIQRIYPGLAERIMNGLGFRALAKLE